MGAEVDLQEAPRTPTWHSYAGVPVRSLWVLLVYASGLARFIDSFDAVVQDEAELPDILGRLLTFVVERRLRRNLTRAYRGREAILTRVRGRIDWLKTEAGFHLEQGEIACRFEELTINTPRNRLVRAALEATAAHVHDFELEHRCRTLARDLARLGVGAGRPSRAEMAREHIARHEADDRLMVTVAHLALDLVLPSEIAGDQRATRLDRNEILLRQIFEKAVAGFYRHELDGRNGWLVHRQRGLSWAVDDPTEGLVSLLPGMAADIVLEQAADRRIVLDTKFTNILKPRHHGGEGFKSEHLYQLYAYLRSQAGLGDPVADRAEGLLLHPTLNNEVDEAVTIQGHRVRFATVDLASQPADIRRRLLEVVQRRR